MKKIQCILVVSLILIGNSLLAQNIAINITGAPADNSAILDVSSTNKGLLTPRLTQTQRNAIPTPATGLLIYQTDNTPGYYYYDGSAWTSLGGQDNDWAINGADIAHYNGYVDIGYTRITEQVYFPGLSPDDTALVVRSNSLEPTMYVEKIFPGMPTPALVVRSYLGTAIEAYSYGFGGEAIYTNGGITVDTGNVNLTKGDLFVNGGITIKGAPGSVDAGSIRWNGADFEGFDGTVWKSLTSGTGHWTQLGGNVYRNTGAVLVGATSPSWGAAFEVEGDATFSSTISNYGLKITSDGFFEPALLPTTNNYGVIGNSTTRLWAGHFANLTVYNTFTNLSDKKVKENIQPIIGALDQVLHLNGKRYDLKSEFMLGNDSIGPDKRIQIDSLRKNKMGFIAQEVEQVLPNLVHYDADADLKSVDYIGMIPLLVEAIKEQQSIINNQNQKLLKLEQELNDIKSQN